MQDQEWRSLISGFEDHLKAERGLAALTIRNHKTDLEPLYDYMQRQGIAGVSALDRARLRAYLAWLAELGYVRRSIARKLSALRTFLRWLLSRNLIDKDPLPKRRMMKVDSRLPRFLSQDEARRLVQAPEMSDVLGPRDRGLLELIYAAGLRVSEVNGLNISEMNLGHQGGPGDRQGLEAESRANRPGRQRCSQPLSQRGSSQAGGTSYRQRAVSKPLWFQAQPTQHSEKGTEIREQGGLGPGRPHPHASTLLCDPHDRREAPI